MLALAVMLSIQDHDETIAMTPTTFKAKTMPYMKADGPYHCPAASQETCSYALNPHIAGKSFASFTAPEKIVMIYEGKDGRLNFRHDGKAMVGFLDGRCRLVDAAEAKQLTWH